MLGDGASAANAYRLSKINFFKVNIFEEMRYCGVFVRYAVTV